MNVGGPARHVLAAARGLAQDFDTTLLVGDVGPEEDEARAWIGASGVTPERVPGLGRAVRPLDDLRVLGLLTRRLRDLRPQIVHTHTAKAGTLGRLAARRAAVPVVVHTFHGHVFDGYFGGAVSRGLVAVERRLALRTDAVVAVSDEIARDLVERYRIAPAAKVRVIPPGVDLAPFRAAAAGDGRSTARRTLGIAPEARVVAWAGRMVPVKEPALALDVARRVAAAEPGVTLLLAGDGPLRAELQRSAPPCVRFLGSVEDIASVHAAADVVLLTSRNEGAPVALIEAAAAGRPVVATRVGGVASVVDDGRTGTLVPSGDAAGLAAAVLALLRDPAQRRAFGAAAAPRAAERFSTERMLDDLRALYAELGVRADS